jgi:soluble lytic murein transglycosylase-like protein
MPGTARELGVDADDPLANLEGGARYLRAQLDRFGGDVEKALAAYNAGPGRVESAGGVPAIRETQAYVASVMGRLSDNVRSSN